MRGDLPGGRGAGAGPLGGAAGGQRPSRPRSQMTSRWRASWASWKRTSEQVQRLLGRGPQLLTPRHSYFRKCPCHSAEFRNTKSCKQGKDIDKHKQTNKRKNQRKACLWPPRRGGRPSPRLALSSSSGPLLCPTLELRPRFDLGFVSSDGSAVPQSLSQHRAMCSRLDPWPLPTCGGTPASGLGPAPSTLGTATPLLLFMHLCSAGAASVGS